MGANDIVKYELLNVLSDSLSTLYDPLESPDKESIITECKIPSQHSAIRVNQPADAPLILKQSEITTASTPIISDSAQLPRVTNNSVTAANYLTTIDGTPGNLVINSMENLSTNLKRSGGKPLRLSDGLPVRELNEIMPQPSASERLVNNRPAWTSPKWR